MNLFLTVYDSDDSDNKLPDLEDEQGVVANTLFKKCYIVESFKRACLHCFQLRI